MRRQRVTVVFPCVCACVCVCLSVTTWSPQLQGCATFWAYQQKAATENARKKKQANCSKVVLLQRYNHVKSENTLFLHGAILISQSRLINYWYFESTLSCGPGLLRCLLIQNQSSFFSVLEKLYCSLNCCSFHYFCSSLAVSLCQWKLSISLHQKYIFRSNNIFFLSEAVLLAQHEMRYCLS